jgi:two-component system CheB/CheR fusion protein
MDQSQLLLVGIASSAGGLTPMMELIEEAICHKNMAFVVVPHLSRDAESSLPSILSRVSKLKIKKIEDGDIIEPCHLYVLPPGYYATVHLQKFALQRRPDRGINKAADVLFESLAEDYGENAIGVVLSGSAVGADGSQGLCAIKANHGHTYVQDPLTAKFSDMPELALATGCVDSVLTPTQIGQELTLVSWATEKEDGPS